MSKTADYYLNSQPEPDRFRSSQEDWIEWATAALEGLTTTDQPGLDRVVQFWADVPGGLEQIERVIMDGDYDQSVRVSASIVRLALQPRMSDHVRSRVTRAHYESLAFMLQKIAGAGGSIT